MTSDNNNISNKELLDAVSDGFSKLEEKIDKNRKAIASNREAIQENSEAIKNLDHKVDSLRNRLNAEILRYTDQHADHEKRITALEEKIEA
jgi:predicted  nucleic acid-binding Zn-ribbon protein